MIMEMIGTLVQSIFGAEELSTKSSGGLEEISDRKSWIVGTK